MKQRVYNYETWYIIILEVPTITNIQKTNIEWEFEQEYSVKLIIVSDYS